MTTPAPSANAAATAAGERFFHAGGEFRVGTVRWWGDAIISAEAIYLLLDARAEGDAVFRLFETLADRLLPRRTLPHDPYEAVPEAVRGDPRWPARKANYAGAIVIPKGEVALLLHQRVKLRTRLIFDGIEVAIEHGRFGGGRVRDFADWTRWPMCWDGEARHLPPEVARDVRERVRQMPFMRPVVSTTTIAAGFVLGALPMLLSLVPRMDAYAVSALWLGGWISGVALVLFGWTASRRGL